MSEMWEQADELGLPAPGVGSQNPLAEVHDPLPLEERTRPEHYESGVIPAEQYPLDDPVNSLLDGVPGVWLLELLEHYEEAEEDELRHGDPQGPSRAAIWHEKARNLRRFLDNKRKESK